jgi:hypothetical protein
VARRRSEAELESDFQSKVLIPELRALFQDCFILKNDANYLQGVPDLLVIWRSRWALLEVKASENSVHQPNQDYYIDSLGLWSYTAFIYPENKDIILAELQQAFGAGW